MSKEELDLNFEKSIVNKTLTCGITRVPEEIKILIDKEGKKYRKSSDVKIYNEFMGDRTIVYLKEEIHCKLTKDLFISAIKTIKTFFRGIGEFNDFNDIEYWITEEKDAMLIIKYNEMAITIAPRVEEL